MNGYIVAINLLIAGLIALARAESAPKFHDVTKLQVGIKYRPETCDRKAANGDMLEVHYTVRSSTTSNNEKP